METSGAARAFLASALLSAATSGAPAQESPPDSPQARQIVALVEKAAALIEARGKTAAFAEFRKEGSEWFDGERYLFSYDLKGNVILNPAFPKREGTNVVGQTDARGKKFHDAIIATAESRGSGWVDYMFPRPGQTTPSHKWTYVKRVSLDGVPGLIGAGFYGE